MGCDGGTIPRRDELVRLKKKPEQKDKDAEREFRWRHCALTQQRLQEPIVMCGLGRLYSKQNIIEQLLEKDKMPESSKHIKTMKDIKSLNLTPNPSYTDEDKTGGLLDTRHAPYICKLFGLEMSGKFRFIALWSCGCVLSERALKRIKGSANICPLCQAPFQVEDVIVLNAASDEDLELMQVKIEMRNVKRKVCKKDKKEKIKEKEKVETVTTTNVGLALKEKQSKEKLTERDDTEQNTQNKPSTSKIVATKAVAAVNNGNTLKAKIIANAKRMAAAAAGNDAMQDPELKRLKTDYSVARDPKATDVYKSLFTSHKSEQEQTRAHWVTYNPFYN